jgi:hypothetical protein
MLELRGTGEAIWGDAADIAMVSCSRTRVIYQGQLTFTRDRSGKTDLLNERVGQLGLRKFHDGG